MRGKQDAAMEAWAEGGNALPVNMSPAYEALADQPCECLSDRCRTALRHARVAVASRETDARQVADLLLMLGLARDEDLAVEPLTAKQPERSHK